MAIETQRDQILIPLWGHRTIAKHVSGDLYLVEYVTSTLDGEMVGHSLVQAVGPVSARELGIQGPLAPSADLAAKVKAAVNLTLNTCECDDATVIWLEAEDYAGRLSYPLIGCAAT